MPEYRTPIPERIEDMIDAFKWYDEEHPRVSKIRMLDGHVKGEEALEKNFCGSPGCHAGLFGILYYNTDSPSKRISSYTNAGDMMAKYLYDDMNANRVTLEDWAMRSKDWPNDYGHLMFCSCIAFGIESNITATVTIKRVVKTWKQVLENIRKENTNAK